MGVWDDPPIGAASSWSCLDSTGISTLRQRDGVEAIKGSFKSGEDASRVRMRVTVGPSVAEGASDGMDLFESVRAEFRDSATTGFRRCTSPAPLAAG